MAIKYKNLKVTYAELSRAMKLLGFQSRIEKSKDEVKERLLGKPRYFIVFFNEREMRFYPVFQQGGDALVDAYDLFHISRQLRDFGYVNDYDDLAKLIEKNRLPEPKMATA